MLKQLPAKQLPHFPSFFLPSSDLPSVALPPVYFILNTCMRNRMHGIFEIIKLSSVCALVCVYVCLSKSKKIIWAKICWDICIYEQRHNVNKKGGGRGGGHKLLHSQKRHHADVVYAVLVSLPFVFSLALFCY